MAIDVTCPGCHTRFKVSEKFAGRSGPCPKCKAPIKIPTASEQVVVHEPEHSEAGARTATGQLVLKPLDRIETVIHPVVVAGFAGGALVLLLMAFVARTLAPEAKTLPLALGALLVAPPLAWGGYHMLRNDEELQPFSGRSLAVRTAICSIGYALLWLIFSVIYRRFFGDNPVEVWSVVILAPLFMLAGASWAYVCYDLELGNGFFHYTLYLVVTIVLRMAMGLPAVGPEPKAAVKPPSPAVTSSNTRSHAPRGNDAHEALRRAV